MPFKESQTSYIARLAEAHSVTVGDLLNHEIASVVDLAYLTRCSKRGGNGFLDHCYALNGYGKWAEEFSLALSVLCCVEKASEMTLKSWREVFPSCDLLRTHKAWCPACLHDWQSRSEPIYEPLLWSIKAVKVCSKHRVFLETQCPLCKKEIPVLARKSRNGFCSFCGAWLGSCVFSKSIEEKDTRFYDAINVERLIGQQIEKGASLAFIHQIVQECGSLCSFAKRSGVSKGTASEWLSGKVQPTLGTILRLCHQADTRADEALGRFNQEAKINMPSSAQKMSRGTRRKISWPSIEKQLYEIIGSTTDTPPSIRELSRQLGIDKKLLHQHFPAVCKDASTRHMAYSQTQKKRRFDDGKDLIKKAIETLVEAGVYPSRRSIESLLPVRISLREEEYKESWQKYIKISTKPDLQHLV